MNHMQFLFAYFETIPWCHTLTIFSLKQYRAILRDKYQFVPNIKRIQHETHVDDKSNLKNVFLSSNSNLLLLAMRVGIEWSYIVPKSQENENSRSGELEGVNRLNEFWTTEPRN